jgi:hypothetical protein
MCIALHFNVVRKSQKIMKVNDIGGVTTCNTEKNNNLAPET